MATPAPAVNTDVWCAVSALALDAMEHGRTVLWASAHAASGTAQDAHDGVDAASVAAAGRLAVARFWTSMESYASAAGASGKYPDLSETHPFICRRQGALQVNMPLQI